MGYQTPNIDRMAAEGMSFTDAYADILIKACTKEKLNANHFK